MRNDLRTRCRVGLMVATVALLEKRKAEAVVMLESCGLRPRDIPLWTDLRRDGPVVHLDRYVRDPESGNIRLKKPGVPEIEEITISPKVIPGWIPSV